MPDVHLYNREVMMARFQQTIAKHLSGGKSFKPLMSVNCHHNYAERETHYNESVYVTRKGAVRAGTCDLGIIPGSMGAKSYIARQGQFRELLFLLPWGWPIDVAIESQKHLHP